MNSKLDGAPIRDLPEDCLREDGHKHAGALLRQWLAENPGEVRRQVTLADFLGVSAGCVSRWISGERRPKNSTLLALRALTGLHFHGWDAPAPPPQPAPT